jgi:hypothetical protein
VRGCSGVGRVSNLPHSMGWWGAASAAVAVSAASLASGWRVRPDVAITGCITLRSGGVALVHDGRLTSLVITDWDASL